MKKVFYSTIFAAIMIGSTVMYTSCQKEEKSSNNKIEANNETAATPTSSRLNRTWNLDDLDCYPPKGNCFDDVIVTASQYNQLLDCVSGGPIYTGNYFNGTAWTAYLSYLLDAENQPILSLLQSGNAVLTEEVNSITEKKYILVSETNAQQGDEPIYVFEFTIN